MSIIQISEFGLGEEFERVDTKAHRVIPTIVLGFEHVPLYVGKEDQEQKASYVDQVAFC